MEKLVKIHSLLSHRANKTVKMMTLDGQKLSIVFDKDCIAEVSEDVVVDLLKEEYQLEVVDKDVALKVRKEQDATGEKIKELNQKVASLEGNVAVLKKTNEELVSKNELLLSKIAVLEAGEVKDESDADLQDVLITKIELQKMKVEDLKAVAAEAKLPLEEYDSLVKKDLVDYLFAKLNDSPPIE